MRGKQISSPEGLLELALKKKAVAYWNSHGKLDHMAAAFMIGMPFKTVMHLINKGIYIYKPE